MWYMIHVCWVLPITSSSQQKKYCALRAHFRAPQRSPAWFMQFVCSFCWSLLQLLGQTQHVCIIMSTSIRMDSDEATRLSSGCSSKGQQRFDSINAKLEESVDAKRSHATTGWELLGQTVWMVGEGPLKIGLYRKVLWNWVFLLWYADLILKTLTSRSRLPILIVLHTHGTLTRRHKETKNWLSFFRRKPFV